MSKPFNARIASRPVLERLAKAAVKQAEDTWIETMTAYDEALEALIDENKEMQDAES